jgi:DNA-directed RNA polymerase subunit K/omega
MIDRSKLPSSFEFVVTAGARARQLLAGSTPRVDVADRKETTVAQEEVLSGHVAKLDHRMNQSPNQPINDPMAK